MKHKWDGCTAMVILGGFGLFWLVTGFLIGIWLTA